MDRAIVLAIALLCVVGWNAFIWWRGWHSVRALGLLQHGAVLVDVGTADEFASRHVEGATHVSLEEIAANALAAPYRSTRLELARDRAVIVYARTPARSTEAAQRLRASGYRSVMDFGTMDRWP
jgi:rhodanese-related sulfurtransferase